MRSCQHDAYLVDHTHIIFPRKLFDPFNKYNKQYKIGDLNLFEKEQS